MKKKISYIVIGLIIIAIGVTYAGDILSFWEVNFSFNGWWSLFIIVPAVVSMVSGGVNAVNIIIAGVGILLFLGARNALPNDAAYKLIFPFVIVVFGFSILFKKVRKPTEKGNNGLYAGSSGVNYFAVFGGNSPQFKGVDFRGANTFAIFGGIDLRLHESFIKRDCIINAYSIFGGTDIILPKNVHASVSSTPVFGSVDNKFFSDVEMQNAPTVYIRAVSVFGGIDIK
jgi:predicted membrane protein